MDIEQIKRHPLLPWAVLFSGLAVMYLPTLHDLVTNVWLSEAQRHGPIVMAIGLWLMYRKWPQAMGAAEARPALAPGWVVLMIGVIAYVIGRSQAILIFEVGSLLWVFAGIILLYGGTTALKGMLFPLVFLLFMVPLPGEVVDALTLPMKIAVSHVAESILYAIGYPIARSGVVLQIGQYKLLVADACAGLHTLFTLEALGLLYLNLVRHPSMFRNVVLAIMIVPISFAANTIRVMVLTLVTYHFGDEAGQGFLHGFAGMVLFMSALLLIIGLDSLLRFGDRNLPSGNGGGPKGTTKTAEVTP